MTPPPSVDGGVDSSDGTGDGGPLGPDASDGASDSPSSDGGPIPVVPGDVVVLSGETITAGAGERVSEWRNAIAPTIIVAKPVNATGPVRVPVVLPNGENTSCAAWSDGDSPLSAAADPAFAIGVDDYSFTAVVQQGPAIAVLRDDGRVVASIVTPNLAANNYSGFALMTEYQDAERNSISKAVKFATRISFAASVAVEVVEPTLSGTGLHVVTSYRRGDELRMRVDGTAYGPTAGASNVLVPSGQPLLLGSTRTDGDPNTQFAGRLCALVIHRGAESDAEIEARIAKLRARFLP